MASAIAFSAPGKVLLAGGYLVLDRKHTGLVFGLDARIHVAVQHLSGREDPSRSEIIVTSPQFENARWQYEYQETEGNGGIQIIPSKSHPTSQSRNKFIETALAYALTYVLALEPASIRSTSFIILADTDYYSHSAFPNTKLQPPDQRFHNFNVPLHQAHKTGLGSSAALVTAFVAAVVAHYLGADRIPMTTENGRACLHSLAQIAHCAAQGKVGSGFDVAAAVYGSCVYRRFSPSWLEGLGEVGTKGFSTRLRSLVGNGDEPSAWDMDINKSRAVIPSGLRLVMCDVDCGSETVGMAKKVLAWKACNTEVSAQLWEKLQNANEDLAEELWSLTQTPRGASSDYEQLSKLFITIRSLIREMSRKAGVPIEPQAQTDLLDTCCRVPGIFGGVVPGAGGYDAIILLIEDRREVMQALNRVLASYSPKERSEGEPSIGHVRLLGVKQDTEGLRIENTATYHGWI